MKEPLLSISTPLVEIPSRLIANLSKPIIRKLAIAVAGHVGKTDPADATVEDLLSYFPMRYEDRSKFLSIDQIEDGMEAAVQLSVRTANGTRVGRNRDPRKPPLYLFQIIGSDLKYRSDPVLIKWFISGRNAGEIAKWYEKRFAVGTQFVAYGKWELDDYRRLTLMTTKPEELEVLSSSASNSEENGENDINNDDGDPAFATIHTGKVPVYRKLGPLQTKRLREVVHSVLNNLDRSSVVDNLPSELRERQNLATRARAFAEIHFPPDDARIAEYEMFRSAAQKRLIFDEFFWLSFAMQLLRGERQKDPKGTVIEISTITKQRLKNVLPFSLARSEKGCRRDL